MKLNKLVYAMFFLYVLAAHFVNHTWLFQVVGFMFVGAELIYILKTIFGIDTKFVYINWGFSCLKKLSV